MSSIYRSFIVLTSGTTLSQIIPFIVAPVLSRIYLPEDYGEFTLYTSILSILILVSTLKYEMAIMIPEYERESQIITHLCVLISIGVFIISLLSFFIFYVCFDIKPIFLLMPLTAFLYSLSLVFDRVYNRNKNFVTMSLLKVSKSSAESGYNLLGFFKLFRTDNLIIGLTIGYFSTFLFVLVKEFNMIIKSFKTISFVDLKGVLMKYIEFPKFTMLHALLNSVSTNLPVILIPIFFTSEDLGYYSFGLKYVQAPMAILAGSLYNIISQDLTAHFKDKEALRKRFFFYLKYLALASIGISFVLLFAPKIFSFIFGNQWAIAGQYVVSLLFIIIVGFVMSSLSYIPMIFNKQKMALYFEVLYFLAKLAPFIVCGGLLKISFESTLLYFSIISGLVLIFNFCWYWRLIHER